MKLSGDVPEEHKELARQLDELEHEIDSQPRRPEKMAQMYACMAHDWYGLNAEEEGHRLLLKAEKVFPGYFKSPEMKNHLKDDTFSLIIKSLTSQLTKLLLTSVDSAL